MMESVSPSTPVLGDNGFELRCSINFTSQEVLQEINLWRKKSTDTDFILIVLFKRLGFPFYYLRLKNSLQSRTVVTQPDRTSATYASITFNDTKCSDIAQYKWIVTFSVNGSDMEKSTTSDVRVRGKKSSSAKTWTALFWPLQWNVDIDR